MFTFDNSDVYDGHVHAHPYCDDVDACVQNALDFLSYTGLAGINILLLKGGMDALGNDAFYLYLKALHPDKFTVYDSIAVGYKSIPDDAEGLRQQVRDMIDAGFDGFKMVTTRSTKDTWGFEIDDERMDPMLDLLEETQFPITWHFGNTERWPEQRGPGIGPLPTRKPGPTPSNEPIYERLENILRKHPRLNLAIPHWLFMAEDRERLDNFMKRHPNVYLDICQGSGMLHYIGLDRENWRKFFVKYQDRLYFGTDNMVEKPHLAPGYIINTRRFLETDLTFFAPRVTHGWGFDITGVGPFDEEMMKKINKENFFRMQGGPHPVIPENAVRFCKKELAQMEALPEDERLIQGKKLVKEVIARFEAMMG